jgi:hypothetical protein
MRRPNNLAGDESVKMPLRSGEHEFAGQTALGLSSAATAKCFRPRPYRLTGRTHELQETEHCVEKVGFWSFSGDATPTTVAPFGRARSLVWKEIVSAPL